MIYEEESRYAKTQYHCYGKLLASVHVVFHFQCIWHTAYVLQRDLECKAEWWPFYTLKLISLSGGDVFHSKILSCGAVICSESLKIVCYQCNFMPCKDVNFSAL